MADYELLKKKFLALPITKIPKLSKRKFYTFQPRKIDKVDNCVKLQGKADWKPLGTWFAKGSTWLDFLYRECADLGYAWGYERAKLYTHVYEVELNESKIYAAKSEMDVLAFTNDFGIVVPSRGMRKYNSLIDWVKVTKKYSGILCPYRSWSWNFLWQESWDVSSGCVIHPSGVKKLKLVFGE